MNFKVAVYLRHCGADDTAFFRYLSVALVQRGDAEAWALAFLLAFQANEAALVALVGRAAYSFVGDDLIHHVMESVRFDGESELSRQEHMRMALQQCIRDLRDVAMDEAADQVNR